MRLNVIITGASGMVGKGVLLECLDNQDVDSVLVVGRRSINMDHPKLQEILLEDFFDLSSIETEISSYNACYFCLGTTSVGKSEADYRRITYDLTLHFAHTLLKHSSDLSFCYVSGAGTDAKGNSMWQQVKGKTENDLLALPFKLAYMFRPGYIQPLRGTRTSVAAFRIIYLILRPLYPLLRLMPAAFIDTVQIGQAMLNVSKQGYPKAVLENKDIHIAAKA